MPDEAPEERAPPGPPGDSLASAPGDDRAGGPADDREDSEATLTARLKARVQPALTLAVNLLPWGSLVVGLVSAFLQDRTPDAAKLVIPAAVLGWLAVIGFGLLQRLDPDAYEGWRARALKAGRLSTIFLMQSLMQQCLFFALPFYVLSASFVPGHVVFLILLAGAAAITLWDPLYERVVEVHAARFGLQFVATFVSVNAMLPALGVSNRTSLMVSGAVAALGVPLQGWILKEGSRREILIAGGVAVVGLPLFLLVGGAASLPPAPITLTRGAIGTSYADYEVQDPRDEIVGRPEALVCGTDIRAPHGLKEKLFHVWEHPSGQVTDRIELTIRGGREEGFRTYTRKQRLGRAPWGKWKCSVMTESGQLVGQRCVELVERGDGSGEASEATDDEG